MQLRQEANELQEYSNAKLDRVTRYLGVLAEKTRKLGKKLIFPDSWLMLRMNRRFWNIDISPVNSFA